MQAAGAKPQIQDPNIPLWCFPASANNTEPVESRTGDLWEQIQSYLENKTSVLPLRPLVTKEDHFQFKQFAINCRALPTLRMLEAKGAIVATPTTWELKEPIYQTTQLVSFDQFQSALTQYCEVMKEQLKEAWLGERPTQPGDIHNSAGFLPYSQKLIVPPGTRCIFKGDLQGDIHSLVAFVRKMQQGGDTDPQDPLKLKKETYLMFLGDYVDRGGWGLEAIYLLMQLKIKNPEQVFLVRGNHEDPEMAGRLGLFQECKAKFGAVDQKDAKYLLINAFYNTLPIVLYLGSGSSDLLNFQQCCHGGMEWGYNPKYLLAADDKRFEWIQEFKRADECNSHPELNQSKVNCLTKKPDNSVASESIALGISCVNFKAQSPKEPHCVGFMQHEFHVDPTSPTSYESWRKVYTCGKALTAAVFSAASTEKKGALFRHPRAPACTQ